MRNVNLMKVAITITLFFVVGCTSKQERKNFVKPLEHSCRWKTVNDVLTKSITEYFSRRYSLTPPEAAEDLACLALAFKHQYIADVYYKSKTSLYDRVMNFRENLPKGNITIDSLLDRLMALHSDHYDTHFIYNYEDGKPDDGDQTTFRKHQVLWPYKAPDEVANWSCEGTRSVNAITKDGKETKMQIAILPFDAKDEIMCQTSTGPRKVKLTKISLSKKQPPPTTFVMREQEENGKRLLYVRMPSMPGGTEEQQKELLNFVRTNPKTPVLLDLRQNLGGDDAIAYEIARWVRKVGEKHEYAAGVYNKNAISLF